MKALIGIFLLLGAFLGAFPGVTAASGKSLESADIDVFDQASLRRGAALFADYCMGCHSLRQIRFSRIAKDAGMSADELQKTLMYGDKKPQDYVTTAYNKADAEAMFGVAPPDLSLVVRSRGADWVFTYLKGFYVDPKRPWGVNNLLVQNVAMPNPLWYLQGVQEPEKQAIGDQEEIVSLRLIESGSLSPEQFNAKLNDLVSFLAYVSEPAQQERLPLGKYVLLFLIVMTVILYKLKKEYWKDVH